MIQGAWAELGVMVWLRFRALGVPAPLERTADWLRSHGGTRQGVLLADSVRWALTAGAVDPDPVALEALGVTAAQIDVVRRQEPDVFLHRIDGMDLGAATDAVGSTVTSLQQQLLATREDFEACTPELPAGSQPDGHLDTLQLNALLAETLSPMMRGQVEDHVEKCSWCAGRYLAWTTMRESFLAMPQPAPPPPRSYTVPALFLIAAATASALSALAVAIVVWSSSTQQAEEHSWRHRPAEIHLYADDAPIEAGSAATGQAVSIRFDPKYAEHYAAVLVDERGPNVLYQGPVPNGAREQLVPADLIVGNGPSTVYVLLAEHPIDPEAVQGVVTGSAPPELSVALVPLRR